MDRVSAALREVNHEALERYFYWINERHRIYMLKHIEASRPWTADPILRQYKFTNVFRRLDRGSQWLINNWLEPRMLDFKMARSMYDANILTHAARQWPEVFGDLIGNIANYRMFNWWPTGEKIGWRERWEPKAWAPKLREAFKRGEKVFTSAHIIRSRPGSKIDSVVETLTPIWKDRRDLAVHILRCNRLEDSRNAFMAYPLIGCFMAYEFTMDLTYTPVLVRAEDRMTWANPGPGATRGLRMIFPELTAERDLIAAMRYLLDLAPQYLGNHVPELEMHDIEMVACEFFKYEKARTGTGRPRERYNGGVGERSLFTEYGDGASAHQS